MRELSEEVAFANGRFLIRVTRDVPFEHPDGSWGTMRAPPGPYWGRLHDYERRTVWGVVLFGEVAP